MATAEQKTSLNAMARMSLAKRCEAEGDVLGWCKALVPGRFSKPFCRELHGFMVEHRKDAFLSLEAPRGTAKTNIGCFAIPLYQGVVEHKTYKHYLNVQANSDKALDINRAIKMELEQNPLIRMLYGEQVGKERWTDGCFVTTRGIVYSCIGSGASIRGINYRGRRPDYVVNDDFYNTEQDGASPESIQKKNDWFLGSLYPAMASDRPSSMHFQGTAVSREDLFEKLRADASVTPKTFRSVKNWDTGEVLWPEMKSFEELCRLKTLMGTWIFSREYQNERRDDSSAIIKYAWLYPEDGSPSWEYDPDKVRFGSDLHYLAGIVTLDPSIGKKAVNDKSGYAFVVKAQRQDGTSLPEYYIEQLVNEHHSMDERIKQVKSMCSGRASDRPATKAKVETISGFKDVGDKIAAAVGVSCELVDRVPDKITNLERHSALFENRRVHLNRNIADHLKKELSYQLCTNVAKNDDLRDAVLLGLEGDDGSWASWV